MIAENDLKRIKSHSERIKKEVRKRTFQYVLNAFGLITALAWNELIQSTIAYLFPFPKNNLLLKSFYALFLTILLVFISLSLEKQEQ